MNLSLFPGALDEIERRIRELQPHAIVLGLGPSAWFMPQVDRKLLEGVRVWGMNDSFRIMPTDDLVVMDLPQRMLHPATVRGKAIVESRPKRLWLYCKHSLIWKDVLDKDTWDEHCEFDLTQYNWQKSVKAGIAPRLTDDPPAHILQSPTGITSLAWQQGARRIGVIGCDLLPGHHVQSHLEPAISWFFSHLSAQAALLGGRIVNLSPISQVKFHQCSQSASSSAATQASA